MSSSTDSEARSSDWLAGYEAAQAPTGRRPMMPEDYWCTVCDRGAEGCLHPIEEPAVL